MLLLCSLGGRIDHAHHEGLSMKALNDTVALSDAVQQAVSLTDAENTLIVATADHSHVFAINGYPSINTNILGLYLNTSLRHEQQQISIK